jgi:hypothetical protein
MDDAESAATIACGDMCLDRNATPVEAMESQSGGRIQHGNEKGSEEIFDKESNGKENDSEEIVNQEVFGKEVFYQKSGG